MRRWQSPPRSGRSLPRAQPDTSAAFFAGGLALSGLYAATGRGLPCPFRAMTGWDCPLCGGTRMGAALLHGDVQSAFMLNPLALIGLLTLGVLGLLWVVEAAGGPALELKYQFPRLVI